ncbi:MAG: GNAT family N-acetyltransferase [Chitinophagaceae bacterium]
MNSVQLRKTTLNDLPLLFEFQLDKEANFLAAFNPANFNDKEAYLNKHARLLGDHKVNNQTILFNNKIVGSTAKFEMDGHSEITYWIDRKFWGKGIATTALKLFLQVERSRPLTGRVAFDNFGSQKVLERCGFERIGSNISFANARQKEIEEYIYKLSA